MTKQLAISFLCFILIAASCKKNSSISNIYNGKITILLDHKVDSKPLIFDSVAFINEAQNEYSVSRVQYYLSSFKLYKGSKLCYSGNDVFYLDARKDSLSSLIITPTQGLETGVYDSITFYIGVDPVLNVTNGLPQTLENIAMGWPDMMGGGYHFFKLEGHWKDNGTLSGFAMHIGENGFQVHVCVPCNVPIQSSGNPEFKMTMNVNEWFRSPHVYNFSTDGVFSMGDTVLMKKLAENGRDAFYKYQ